MNPAPPQGQEMVVAPQAGPPQIAFVRGAICLDCRTVLRTGEICDGGPKHRVAPIGTPEGRAKLLSEVWGPPSVRRRARQLAKAGGGGAGVGGLLDGCSSCGGCDAAGLSGEGLLAILVVIVFALVAMVLYWVVVKIIEWVRAWKNRPKPNGGLLRPPWVGRRSGPAGVVVGPAALPAPGTGTPCAAYAVDLRCKRFLRADRMLHDAEACTFDVQLEDGSMARIPAGRVRLQGPMRRVTRGDAQQIDAYVKTIAPADEDGFEPIPYDLVDEVVLRPGDRVRLYGELERVADPNTAGAYRQAQAYWVPQGVPALRVEMTKG